MARQLKTNGIYNVTCVVTGEKAGTTPAVFDKRAKRYGTDVNTLKDNYVGRTATKLIRAMVDNGKATDAGDAVDKIRAEFGLTGKPVADQILDKVMEPIKAKAAAKKADDKFEATKARALEKLLG